eukprot:475712-Lingulodinium_polyedra.AAC.1
MVGLFHERTLNARQLCIAMHFAGKAGIAEAAKLGYRPGAQSGKYNAHLKRVWKTDTPDGSLYTMSVPGHAKQDLSRTLHDIPVFPPHELVAQELAEDGAALRVAEYIDVGMPPAYHEHPVVLGQGTGAGHDPVCPLALYLDFLPYSLTDSVLGWWIHILPTDKRLLFALCRKRMVCKCGCRGWCTFHAFFSMLRWSLEALARG